MIEELSGGVDIKHAQIKVGAVRSRISGDGPIVHVGRPAIVLRPVLGVVRRILRCISSSNARHTGTAGAGGWQQCVRKVGSVRLRNGLHHVNQVPAKGDVRSVVCSICSIVSLVVIHNVEKAMFLDGRDFKVTTVQLWRRLCHDDG